MTPKRLVSRAKIDFSTLLRVVLLYLLVGLPAVYAQGTQDAQALKARYLALHEQLTNNPYQRPLYIESSETSGRLAGDIYALVEQPFAALSSALVGIDHWCDILILHLNVKSCRASSSAGDTLSLNIGRKSDQPLGDTYQIDFLYQVVVDTPDYLQVMLNAEQGPLGTSNYRVKLEAVKLDDQRNFLHFSYSYHYGVAARMATQSYLATVGHNKVGFSIVGHQANGQPDYVGGIRGIVERNAMRYFLAIEAYLGAPAPQQLEKRLSDWYAGIERYPLQLHNIERNEYLDMKRKEAQAESSTPTAK
ncbi:hypothetical protein [Pseudomonas sp. H11T01]|uniref:hypothetical protein n=1 Tax=Pseudomonas sp. H11T01 TaxID=3402749 RepID=UPI003AEF5EE9